jgi:hypothetical protein
MGKKSREKKERKESIVTAITPAVRQIFQPKEFRLGPYRGPTLQQIKALQDFHAMRAKAAETQPASALEVFPKEAWRPFLANLGTGLWRLRQRMLDPSTGQPLEEMRRAYRHFESVWDMLAESGIQILDHKGQSLPERGFSDLHVSAYQPTPGLKKERVIDTIKPTISIKRAGSNQDILIQMGEVIVGTPEERSGEVLSPQDETPKRV